MTTPARLLPYGQYMSLGLAWVSTMFGPCHTESSFCRCLQRQYEPSGQAKASRTFFFSVHVATGKSDACLHSVDYVTHYNSSQTNKPAHKQQHPHVITWLYKSIKDNDLQTVVSCLCVFFTDFFTFKKKTRPIEMFRSNVRDWNRKREQLENKKKKASQINRLVYKGG